MKKCSRQNPTVSKTDISKISKMRLHKFMVQGDTILVWKSHGYKGMVYLFALIR